MATVRTLKSSTGHLGPEAKLMPSSGWMRKTRALGLRPRASLPSKGRMGRSLEEHRQPR